MTGKVRQVVGFVCLAGTRVGTQPGDVGGQVPALTLVQLISKRRHIGAFNPQAKGVIDRVEAQPVQALRVTQVRRRRRHTDTGRAVTGAGFTVAHRAMLGIQGCATGRVRGNGGGLADLVGHRQFGTQLTCFMRNGGAVYTLFDGALQGVHALQQLLTLRALRQVREQAFEHGQKLELLAVFGLINNLAVFNCRRIVSTNVVNQVQRL